MIDKNHPAFQQYVFDHTEKNFIATGGFNAQEYAAIHLKVPDSGTDWLDEMIKTSLKNEMAVKIVAGLMSNIGTNDWGKEKTAKYAVEAANILMEKLK